MGKQSNYLVVRIGHNCINLKFCIFRQLRYSDTNSGRIMVLKILRIDFIDSSKILHGLYKQQPTFR